MSKGSVIALRKNRQEQREKAAKGLLVVVIVLMDIGRSRIVVMRYAATATCIIYRQRNITNDGQPALGIAASSSVYFLSF